MTVATGQVLQNRYRIVSLLGEGGQGAVYRAWDTRLGVAVALKEMTPQPGLDPRLLAQLRQQFEQEAQVLARLKHPHLVRVTDFFEEGGSAYLVMDFAEGESLAELVEREGALGEEQVLVWAHQLLTALGYCHEQGMIHRDVKPQNVIIRPDGQVVLVDFGLVKLWDPGDPRTKTVMRGMGTPEYSPPEQYDAEAGHTDPRSDIYSLGAMLYHALTGQAPPTATQRIASRSAFQPPRAVNPRISPAAEAAILRAMELAVEDRFPTVGEMVSALSRRVPASVHPAPGVAARVPPRARRPRMLVWALAVIIPVVLATVALLLTRGEGQMLGSSHDAGLPDAGQSTRTPLPCPVPALVPTTGPGMPTPAYATTGVPEDMKAQTATPIPTLTAPPATSVPRIPTAVSPQLPMGGSPVPAPLLTFPEHGRTYQSPVRFQWEGIISIGQDYIVHAWNIRTDCEIQSPVLSTTSWTADLPPQAYGEWQWTVSVVEGDAVIATSVPGMFWFNPWPGGEEPTRPPSGSPVPTSPPPWPYYP